MFRGWKRVFDIGILQCGKLLKEYRAWRYLSFYLSIYLSIYLSVNVSLNIWQKKVSLDLCLRPSVQFFFPKKRKEKNLVATNTNNEINSFSFLHIIVQLYIFLIKFLFWCVHSLTASCLLLKLGFYRRK